MSNSAITSMDAKIHAALKRAGLADGGTTIGDGAILRRKNGTEVPCRVFVNFNSQRVGGEVGVFIVPVEVVVLRADIGDALPAKGDAFVVGDVLYRVEGLVPGAVNESSAACQCLPGVPA